MNGATAAICLATFAACCVLLLVRGCHSVAAALRQLHTRTARRDLADLFIFIEPRAVSIASALLALFVAGCVLLTGLSLLLALPPMLVVLFAPRWVLVLLRRRRLSKLDAQLPEALTLLAGLLRAGQGLSQALAHLAHHQQAPVSQELELLLRKQRMGLSLDQAFAEMHQRAPLADVALVATAVRVSRELGGNLAEALQRLAEAIRARLIMEEKIRSLTAQGRLQGLIVGLLPVVLLLVLSFMEPVVMSVLYREPMGWMALLVIAVLEATGFALIRRIVRIDV